MQKNGSFQNPVDGRGGGAGAKSGGAHTMNSPIGKGVPRKGSKNASAGRVKKAGHSSTRRNAGHGY